MTDATHTLWIVPDQDDMIEVWQSVFVDALTSRVTGRLFRCNADPDRPEDLSLLVQALQRARWPYEVVGEIVQPGLVTRELWEGARKAFADFLEANAKSARDSEAAAPRTLLVTARALGLKPRPEGRGSHQWTARCPRGSSHPIFISTSSEEWGCPWCRRKGGPVELQAFVAEMHARQSSKPQLTIGDGG